MARTIDPRTRPALIRAAGRLFYAHGVGSVGVDEIAAASGLTKPTLYRHFPSKDELVAAYLDDRHQQLDAELRSWLDRVPARHRPSAVIDWLCDWISSPRFNGCGFVRAQAELPEDELIHEKATRRKRTLFEAIEDACRAAGAVDAPELANQLVLIVEGATTMAFVSRDPESVSKTARALAAVALKSCGLAHNYE